MSEGRKGSKGEPVTLDWAFVKRMIVPGLVAVYLTCGLLALGWLLLDISSGQLSFLCWLGIRQTADAEYVGLLKVVLYAAVGGATGGIIFGTMNLMQHVAIRNDFNPVYAGDYLGRPFFSAALAVVVYSLLRGGVLTVLGGDPSSPSTSVVASFSAFGIGFLTGFGSKKVVERLNELIKRIFGSADVPEADKGEDDE